MKLFVALVQLLGALSDDVWSTETACSNVSSPSNHKNENDLTCSTFIYCYNFQGSFNPIVVSCPKNAPYFDDDIKVCVNTKPKNCILEEGGTTSSESVEPIRTTPVDWSAEATCLTENKAGIYKNEDDPTCKTYIYCFLLNGSLYPRVVNCGSSKPYFDSATKSCVTTQPAGCIG